MIQHRTITSIIVGKGTRSRLHKVGGRVCRWYITLHMTCVILFVCDNIVYVLSRSMPVGADGLGPCLVLRCCIFLHVVGAECHKHAVDVDKLYTPVNTVVPRPLYPYRIITLGFLPTFWNNLIFPSSGGGDRLSPNVGKKLPLFAA